LRFLPANRRKATKLANPIPSRLIELGSGTLTALIELKVTAGLPGVTLAPDPPLGTADVSVIYVDKLLSSLLATLVWNEKLPLEVKAGPAKVTVKTSPTFLTIDISVNTLGLSEALYPYVRILLLTLVIPPTSALLSVNEIEFIPLKTSAMAVKLTDTEIGLVGPAWVAGAYAATANSPRAAVEIKDRFVIE
jgi:hypothetical protein